MENDLISIIIPVYKVEKYLERCVISILNQTYQKLEIILVDDGSPDNSGVLCDTLSVVDQRIKVIHKENGGVSSARNVGIDSVSHKSKYICFVDSDDYLPIESIEYLYNGIVENLSDLCCQSNKDIFIDFSKKPYELLNFISHASSYAPYAKLFKTEIILKKNIRYDTDLKSCEDALFIRQYLKHCKNIQLISKMVYCYNSQNENSLSKKCYTDFCFYFLKKLDALSELVDTLPLSAEEKSAFISQRATHGIKISFEHYYRCFRNENAKEKCIISYKQISPYVKTLKIRAPKLENWYKTVGLATKNVKFDNVYFRFRILFKSKRFLTKIKISLNKLLKFNIFWR